MINISLDFTLFVLLTAIVLLFMDEIASSSKRLWGNQLLRNGGLMFFVAFFSFAYRSFVKDLFTWLHSNSMAMSKILVPYIPYFENKYLIAFGLVYILLTVSIVGMVWLLYYLYYRKAYPHTIVVMWGSLIFIGSLFLQI